MREPTGGSVIPDVPKRRDDDRALVLVPVLKPARGSKAGHGGQGDNAPPAPVRSSESRQPQGDLL